MSLYIVPTPIGNSKDFSLRAIEVLTAVDVIIVEEFKESSRQLRSVSIQNKKLEQLNEHTNKEEIQRLLDLCKTQNVALISDCGTPGFCDPGGQLVGLCRKNQISVIGLPGPSSLMLALSLIGKRINQFLFRGFLPAENISRDKEWQKLKKIQIPIILMDTPYRLKKTLTECLNYFPQNQVLLCLNLTQKEEWVMEAKVKDILPLLPYEKAEFILIILPLESDYIQ